MNDLKKQYSFFNLRAELLSVKKRIHEEISTLVHECIRDSKYRVSDSYIGIITSRYTITHVDYETKYNILIEFKNGYYCTVEGAEPSQEGVILRMADLMTEESLFKFLTEILNLDEIKKLR